jgi:hypothetical protein
VWFVWENWRVIDRPVSLRRQRVPTAILTLAVASLALVVDLAAQASPNASPCAVRTTERIVAVGDVHGGYEQFRAILRATGLIDERNRWIGHRAILVQMGDMLDRGAASREAIDLLRQLERDAAQAGGHVYALLGNHEVLRMFGDYRYASEGEYRGFQTGDSQELRERLYAQIVAEHRAQARAEEIEFDETAFRDRFLEQVPLGLIEMELAFGPDGDYGQWLRTRDAMVVINGIAFIHGGASPEVASLGCEAINARVHRELGTLAPNNPALNETLIAGEDGPLWYRGLVDETPPLPDEQIDAILEALGVGAIVVGHTPTQDARIVVHHDGRVFQIDTGMANGEFYPGGVPSALEFSQGAVTAVYLDRREVLVAAAATQP